MTVTLICMALFCWFMAVSVGYKQHKESKKHYFSEDGSMSTIGRIMYYSLGFFQLCYALLVLGGIVRLYFI